MNPTRAAFNRPSVDAGLFELPIPMHARLLYPLKIGRAFCSGSGETGDRDPCCARIQSDAADCRSNPGVYLDVIDASRALLVRKQEGK
jgi:hypothetical protein